MTKEVKSGILGMFKKSGIPFQIVKIRIDPKIQKQVRDYVLNIEEAHRRAAKSKLCFDAALTN